MAQSIAGVTPGAPVSKKYSGTTTLKNGYPVCFDTTKSSANDREAYVTKPTWANLITQRAFAGVVTGAPSGGYTNPNGQDINISIIPWDLTNHENVNVWTDQNVAAGDILAPIPDTFLWGRAVFGFGMFEARAASDRSTTAGVANGSMRPIEGQKYAEKIFRHFYDFDGTIPVGLEAATVDSFPELKTMGLTLQGTSATFAGTGGACGEGLLTPSSTNIGQLNLGGIIGSANPTVPFLIATGKSAFFRGRIKNVGAIDNDMAFGFAIAGALLADGTHVGTQDDYFLFMTNGDVDGSIWFEYNKDNGTDRGIDTGVDVVADTYNDFACLIVNRNSGTTASSGAKYVMLWIDGVLIVGTANPSAGTSITAAGILDVSDLFNADEGMRLALAGIGGASAVPITIDRWEAALSR